MKIKYRFNRAALLTVVLAILGVVGACAQRSPIRWRCTAHMTSDTEGVVSVKALIDDGWHLYGFSMPEGGPKATVISMTSSQDVEYIGEFVPDRKPEVKRDAIFDTDVNFWVHKVVFKCNFKVVGTNPKISGLVTFMGCNDATCLPPATVSLSAPIVPLNK